MPIWQNWFEDKEIEKFLFLVFVNQSHIFFNSFSGIPFVRWTQCLGFSLRQYFRFYDLLANIIFLKGQDTFNIGLSIKIFINLLSPTSTKALFFFLYWFLLLCIPANPHIIYLLSNLIQCFQLSKCIDIHFIYLL